MQEVPWIAFDSLLTPGAADPFGWTKEIGKVVLRARIWECRAGMR